MPNSRVGQYQIEMELTGFTSPVNAHKLRSNVMAQGSPVVGSAPTAIDINLRGGTTANLQVVADTMWGFYRLIYPNTISVASFSLWRWVTNTAREFVSAGVMGTPAGSTGAVVQSWQTTLTFRSGNGGIAKLVFIESNLSGNQRAALVPNAAGTAPQRIAAYAISAGSPLQALDNGFLVAALRDNRGENEAIRDRRLGV